MWKCKTFSGYRDITLLEDDINFFTSKKGIIVINIIINHIPSGIAHVPEKYYGLIIYTE